MFLLAALLSISPWTGHNLPTATTAAAKYRLVVSGKPGTHVHLSATGVKAGWIAAFCDDRVCSPMRVTETISADGRTVVQFELIREQSDAPHASGAEIHDDNGATLRVPAASR